MAKKMTRNLGRRDFVAMSVAAGVAAATTRTASGKEPEVVETDVEIKMPDGICDVSHLMFRAVTGPSWRMAAPLAGVASETKKR